ncbi:MAG TPA: radical SAM protein [Candidatus Hydrogenedentes bacterium]|nr:radical SAM protein [Candidatus Hydrogenedentota bacterium]
MDARETKTLRVTEIYRSIQGESTWAGLPCVFVRLTGCPLRCVWCDTEYSFHGGERMALGAIVAEIAAMNTPLVEITGGEPLAQRACGALAELLIEHGHTVLVETSGALPIDRLPEAATRIMDLKCPDSGECEKNDWDNIERLAPDRDEVKFVLASRRDYEWARDVVRRYRLETRCKCVLCSPVSGAIEPHDLAAWILEDHLPVRLQLQLHKILWAPDAKGV